MSWLKAKSIAFSAPRWCSVGLHTSFPRPGGYLASSSPWSQLRNYSESTSTKSGSNDPHIKWWKTRDLEFPEPTPAGISFSRNGYCMVQVSEAMKTFSKEDGLTEAALHTKLRTCDYHHLFLHDSLKNRTCNWRAFGDGKHEKWLKGDMVDGILLKVKELYGLDEVTFRKITIPSENRPHPLDIQTALHIDAIDFLPDILLPTNCTTLPSMYVRNLLLHPPPYEIAHTIQEICKLMSNVSVTMPHLTCISSSKLVKLLELQEVRKVEFCKMKSVFDEILQLYRDSDLNKILRLLMEPTWLATGLKMDFETLVNECECISHKIGQHISSGKKQHKPSLRALCVELQPKTEVVIFASMLVVIAKALFAHVSEGKRRKWAFPTLLQSQEKGQKNGLKITGLIPYFYDPTEDGAVHNTIDLKSKLCLLTGPYCSGKSSLIHSVSATVLYGICGLMVPAESALIPQFDSIMLHMKSDDDHPDGKSSFEAELSELRYMITRATPKSIVFIDDICGGIDIEKGTCLAASLLEKFDSIGCVGIISLSTSLRDIFTLPLIINNTVFKAMGIKYVDGKKRLSHRLIDGICTETLAFEEMLKSQKLDEETLASVKELVDSLKSPLVRENKVKINCRTYVPEYVDGQTKPIYKLVDGFVHTESIAFDIAQWEGMPEEIVQRAKHLYALMISRKSNIKRIELEGSNTN